MNDNNNKCDVFKMIDDYMNRKDALILIEEYITQVEERERRNKKIEAMVKRDIRREIIREILLAVFRYGIPLGALMYLVANLIK